MPTRVGYLGDVDNLMPAVGEISHGRWPIAAAAANGSYISTNYNWHKFGYGGYQAYWTISPDSPLTLEPYEAPVRVTIHFKNAVPNVYENYFYNAYTTQYGGPHPSLLLSNGSGESFGTERLLVDGDSFLEHFTDETYTIPTDIRQQFAGKPLSISYTNSNCDIKLRGHLKITVETEWLYTKCGAPSNVSVTAPSGGYSTLSWNAGAAGVNNAISSYEIQYRTSNDNTNWGSWTVEGSVNASTLNKRVFSNPADSVYKQFRVRTVGAAGSSWVSDWVTSNTIVVNTTPPTFTASIAQVKLNAAVSNGVYIKGMTKYTATISGASASSPKTIASYSITDNVSGASSTTTS